MTEPAEPLDLDLIAARAASLYEYATLTDEPFQADADQLTGTDVPALTAEIRRLRRELAHSESIRENADFHLGQEMARRQTAEKETDRLEGELKRYVGAEPTIAEEMAYLSRCLFAVHDLCDEAKRTGSLGITPEAVEQAASGERPDDPSDNRRRIYIDGKGNGWISACADEGTEWVVPVEASAHVEQDVRDIADEHDGLREIGRCW